MASRPFTEALMNEADIEGKTPDLVECELELVKVWANGNFPLNCACKIDQMF